MAFTKTNKPEHLQESSAHQPKAPAQFIDSRSSTSQQLQLQSIMRNSQQNLTQLAAQTLIHNASSAQRKTLQRAEDEDLLQGKFSGAPIAQREVKPNNTGLPDQLKTGIESLSGMSMDHVKVHYNSDKPAQLNAHAYAQGSDIHVAPGQEQHLPHEAWHVVQQAQGRVKPTMQMKGDVPVNDDVGLETEADVMGAKAVQWNSEYSSGTLNTDAQLQPSTQQTPAQRWPRIQSESGNFKYTLGVDFQTRHMAASKQAAIALAQSLYDPNHTEGSHSAYVTVIYGDITAITDATEATIPSGYDWAISIDVDAVCMGPAGYRGANGDPGSLDDSITNVVVAGYGKGTNKSPGKITHVSCSI